MSLNRSKNQVKEKINPYEFIKLPEKKRRQYRDEDKHTGVIEYTIETYSPLFIPNCFAILLFARTTPFLLASSPPIIAGIDLISTLFPFFSISTAVHDKKALFTSTCKIFLSKIYHLRYYRTFVLFCQCFTYKNLLLQGFFPFYFLQVFAL